MKKIKVIEHTPEEMAAAVVKYATDHAEEIAAANRLFYDSPMTWRTTTWRGHQAFKCPTDLWVYQEMLLSRRPDLVIETGTAFGGTAMFLADMMDLFGIDGRVVTVELSEEYEPPVHHRIVPLKGSSTDPAIIERVREYAAGAKTVVVILDSDHRALHVAAELAAYAPMVTLDSFLVVEDTNLGPDGPWDAVPPYLAVNGGHFVPQPMLERYLITFNPNGYLWKIR